MSINITVEGGTSKRLLTAGKYCEDDIVITATGGGEGGDPGLPAGYRRVDYIRFSDAQIVDTGQILNQDSKIRVMFTREDSAAMYMFGVVNDGNTASVTAYLASGGSWRFGNKSQAKTITTNENLVQCAVIDKTGTNLPANAHTWTGVNDFQTIGTLTIGAVRNASGSIAAAQFVGKILLFEIWQAGELALQLKPVVSEDGTYRFYDTVSGTFHDSVTSVPLDGGNL